MPSRSHTPPPAASEGKPPRAFVRQCVFYEKYGGCKFGKDCFYAHNHEMTLGVRNAMKMAQEMGRGSLTGGVEIRFDEREKEVKMVRVVESYPAVEGRRGGGGGAFDRPSRREFGGRDDFGFGGFGGRGGRGRFMDRGRRGGFRGAMRGRDQGRFISPIRGSGNIFAENDPERSRRKRHGHKSDSGRRHRSVSPRKRNKEFQSDSSSSPKRKSNKRRSGRSSSSSNGSSSRSNSRSSCHSNSPMVKNKKRQRKRSISSQPDPSRMELRSLAKNSKDSKKHNCSHHRNPHHEHGRKQNGQNQGKVLENGKERIERKEKHVKGKESHRNRRSSSSSSNHSDYASNLKSEHNGNGINKKREKSRWEEEGEELVEKNEEEANHNEKEYSSGADGGLSLVDEREGEEELLFEDNYEDENDESQRKKLLEGLGRKKAKQPHTPTYSPHPSSSASPV